MKFSIVAASVEAALFESPDDSRTRPPESVAMIAELAEAAADWTSEDARPVWPLAT